MVLVCDLSKGHNQYVTEDSSHLKAFTGAKHPLPRLMMLHVVGKAVLAGSSRPPCLAIGISMAGLNILTTWQPAAPRTSHPREQGTRGDVFYDLATPITSTIFHWSQRNTLYMWGSNKRMNSKMQESLGTILEAGFDSLKISFQMKDNAQYSFRTVYYSSISFKKFFLCHSAWLVSC